MHTKGISAKLLPVKDAMRRWDPRIEEQDTICVMPMSGDHCTPDDVLKLKTTSKERKEYFPELEDQMTQVTPLQASFKLFLNFLVL